MPQTTKEFLRARQELLRKMTFIARQKGWTIETAVCPFTNNDVPEFLRRLDKTEAYQRKNYPTINVCNSEYQVA